MSDPYIISLNTAICAVENGLYIGDISSRKENYIDVGISLSENKLVTVSKPKIEFPFLL